MQSATVLAYSKSVRPSVCQRLTLCQYDSRYDHAVFIG